MSEALVAAPQAGGASSVAPLYKRIPYNSKIVARKGGFFNGGAERQPWVKIKV
jgi:hypothetical protein